MPETVYVRDLGLETLRNISRGFFPATLRAIEDLPANRFIASDFALADVGDTAVIGVTLIASIINEQITAAAHGVRLVEADSLVLATQNVKSAADGKVTRFVAASEFEANIAGVASDFTQPGAADEVAIHQATDEEADYGRSIVIVGTDANTDPLVEVITLDAEDSTNVVPGTTEFTQIAGAYTEDGVAVTADVTIEEEGDGTDIVTLPAEAASVGVHEINADVYDSVISFEGPNSDSTYVVVQGYKSASPTTVSYETYTFDGASPSIATSSTRWHHLLRVFVGVFTDAAETDLDHVADDVSLFLGVALGDGSEGQLVPVAFQPNFSAWDGTGSSIDTSQLADNSVTTAKIEDEAVTGAKLLTGFLNVTLLAGQDGGSDNTYALSGAADGDEVVFVGHISTAADIATLADVSANFEITAANVISDNGEQDYSNDQLQVIWIDKT